MKYTILIFFFLLCYNQIEASNNLRWLNKVIKEYQTEKYELIGPLLNGCIKIDKSNCYDGVCCDKVDLLDMKNKTIVSDIPKNMRLTKGGYILLNQKLPLEPEEDTLCFSIFGSRKFRGDTILLDNVVAFYPMKDNFIAYRRIGTTDTIQERVLYKKKHLIQRDTCLSCSCPYENCDMFYIYHKYRFCRSTHQLYDENLNVVLEGDIRKKEAYVGRSGFWGSFPYYKSFFLYSDEGIAIYDEKCRKRYVIPKAVMKQLEHYEDSYVQYCDGIIWDKNLIITDRPKAGTLRIYHRAYKLDGTPVTPDENSFSGYFKNFFIYDDGKESFAGTMDGTKIKHIKLGKCNLEKSGKKWILKRPLSTDTIDLITGLNSDQHIGIKKGDSIGIVNKKGKTILPVCFDKIYIEKLYYIGVKQEKYTVFSKKGEVLVEGKDDIICSERSEFDYEYCENEKKYRYYIRNKKKSKVFYADEINTEAFSNRFLPIKKDGIWQYLEIK